MTQTIHVSAAGLVALKAKLEQAQNELAALREEKSIAYTATGDTWHDNPYFNKLEQDERRKAEEVAELTSQVASAREYTVDERNVTRVSLGSIIHLAREFLKAGKADEQVWEVVGFGETDVKRKRVAYNSPLMEAVLGHQVGDVIEGNSPQGPVEYEILALFKNWDDVPAELKK